MRSVIVVLSSFLISVAGLGQDKILKEGQTKSEWTEGSIMLNDGEELKGLIRYDDKNSLIGYRNGDESRSFTPRSVAAFEFSDSLTGNQRVFYTMEYADSKTNAIRPLFFELLKDFKNFAIISKIDPVDVTDKTNKGLLATNWSPGDAASLRTHLQLTQIETVYFLSADGSIEPYVKVVRKVVDRLLYDREAQKTRVIDKDLVEKYFSKEEHTAMKEFAEKNKLDFTIKDDLIAILDFCEKFRAKKN